MSDMSEKKHSWMDTLGTAIVVIGIFVLIYLVINGLVRALSNCKEETARHITIGIMALLVLVFMVYCANCSH